MSAPIFLDLTHTGHTRARTGIQRVTRALFAALGNKVVAITHDPYLGSWRPLEAWERANVTADTASEKRGARWPVSVRLRGRALRFFGRTSPALTSQLSSLNSSPALVEPELSTPNTPAPLLVPEIFSAATGAALPSLFAIVPGPRVAVFHDAIALKLPELTPAKTVARFPAYLQELLAFDGIAAVSDDSRDSLLAYWRWLGARNPPPVQTIPLGLNPVCNVIYYKPASAARPVVLSVGSVEGRKNHLALLEACEALWQRRLDFELHLIGLAQSQTGAAALARIRTLQAAGRALRYDGPVSDAALEAAYARCSFTVYPSQLEGFGLPILESVAHGKPCICSGRGALGESARGGGCVMLQRVDAESLTNAIELLLANANEIAQLAAAARRRPLRTWHDYANALTAWMRELPRRN